MTELSNTSETIFGMFGHGSMHNLTEFFRNGGITFAGRRNRRMQMHLDYLHLVRIIIRKVPNQHLIEEHAQSINIG